MDVNSCLTPVTIVKASLFPSRLDPVCAFVLGLPTDRAQVSLSRYLVYFGVTCALEAPIYLAFSRGMKSGRRILQVILLNLATHPIVTWLIPLAFYQLQLPSGQCVLAGETFAVLVEAALLIRVYRYSTRKAFAASLAANLFSWWAGLWIAPPIARHLRF